MDLVWAADQMRRKKNLDAGVPCAPVRRLTAALRQGPIDGDAYTGAGAVAVMDPSVTPDTTLGNALSALSIHSHSDEQCRRVCESILALVSDRDRTALHSELVRLRGVERVLLVVRERRGEAALVALRVLDKLSRTSPREISAAGGVEILMQCCEEGPPRAVEAALKVLLGLSFDGECKTLLLRRGVRGLVEDVLQRVPDEVQDAKRTGEWYTGGPQEADDAVARQEVLFVATRLAQRLGEGRGEGRRRQGRPDEGIRLKPLH
eukprot:TRINITY_DN19221_c0_g1_i2.p1 TRINITY_DN19221_c0_g1~~TRINITY_DN19221_c0_g1_i2.p1  ORF type:complete len:309 (+),score=62.26 TRINITY_DN19221_c0_g1_i2:139-927(+)